MARAPYRPRLWRLAATDPAAAYAIAWDLDLSPVTAQILANRGLATPEVARAFLTAGREQLLDPFRLQDMAALVAALKQALADRRRIMVYGDYDVDGITGTAVLVHTLRRLGAAVEFYIPNRFDEGYGLNAAALEAIAGRGYDLVLSVDTGTTAMAEARRAKELGITLLITDHHEPGPELPPVVALVNPKRPDNQYPFTGLSGVGVAFKVAQALCGPASPIPWESIDIVALGTIADAVPLQGENRSLVREGLKDIAATRRPGLRALLDVAGIRADGVNPVSVAFGLAPRINALGRMSDASAGVELLLTADPAVAAGLAGRLDAENKSRQQVEAEIVEQALAQANNSYNADDDRILVLAGEGWHPGVVGIVASRIVEAFYRPAVLLTIDGGEARGSARSIPGFHLYDALAEVSDLFSRFGGHAAAAGLSLPVERLPELRRRLGEVARRRLPAPPQPAITLDAWVDPAQLSTSLVEELERVGPFGQENPSPLLACAGLTLLDVRTIGKEGQHLKARFSDGNGLLLEALGWGMGSVSLPPGQAIDVAFSPRIDTWNGRRNLVLQLSDLRPSDPAGAGAAPSPLSVGDWDPLGHATDAAPARLALAGAAGTAVAEVAVTAAGSAADAIAALAGSGRNVVALCRTPWAAQACQSRHPGVVARAWGEPLPPLPGGAVLALLAPPYAPGQLTTALASAGGDATVCPLWREEDWELAGVALGWPYPDRTDLARLYRHLRSLPDHFGPDEAVGGLPVACREPAGPWNRLRLEAALHILVEVGLAASAAGRWRLMPAPPGAKLELERSERYRRGQVGREGLQACRAWWTAQGNPSLAGNLQGLADRGRSRDSQDVE